MGISLLDSLLPSTYPQSVETLAPKALPRFVLVGLGPHAKHNYFQYFIKSQVYPDLIIDLDCKKNDITTYLKAQHLDIPTLFLKEEYRNFSQIPEHIKNELLKLFKLYNITHAIISTEPKAHYAYLDFFIDNGIHSLVEKPLTAPINSSFDYQAAEQVQKDYDYFIDKIAKHSETLRVDILCHRNYHPIYQFISEHIKNFVTEFHVPMSHCEVYHNDGMWNMPDEFFTRENHPYKYGYGKLLHSGYHFIHLLASLLKTSYSACDKIPDTAELYATNFSPTDFTHFLGCKEYNRFFKQDKYAALFNNPNEFDKLGELDFYGILQFFHQNRKLTTCTLNLLQNGFSHRAWDVLPYDTYKSNGRCRHESINIHFGPLMNIQVHSYVADENKDRPMVNPFEVGGVYHFDVSIFRNAKLIGGKPVETFHSDDFRTTHNLSFNEQARAHLIDDFIYRRPSKSNITEHQLGIKLLSHCLKSLCKKNSGTNSLELFSLDTHDFIKNIKG